MKKILFIILLSSFLFGCGASVNTTSGQENQQYIILMAENLVGYKVSVGKAVNYKILSEDLMPYEMGLLGVTDSEDEKLESLKIKIDKGTHNLKVKNKAGKVIYSKDIYLSAGQIRKVKI